MTRCTPRAPPSSGPPHSRTSRLRPARTARSSASPSSSRPRPGGLPSSPPRAPPSSSTHAGASART
eukprot:5212147-Alexandrium_andersonii.AAC.1